MKKLICLLMMCWLPLSLTVANAMSARMMLNHSSSKTQHAAAAKATVQMPCHQAMQQHDNQKAQASVCVDCAACELATANVTMSTVAPFNTPEIVAEKYSILQASLISIQLPPSIKPPMLH